MTGTKPVVEPDRVLATVLFTDIVGSTEHLTAMGDRRWRDVLAEHYRLARRELARFRGREVKTNTVKDLVAGSGLVFDDRGTHILRGVQGEWRLFQVIP